MVTLRHFSEEDTAFIRQTMAPDGTDAVIAEMIAEWNTLTHQGRYFEMFAVLCDQSIAGYASLYERSKSAASVGIEIIPEARQKGLASSAVSALAARASEKGYRLLLSQVRADNAASIRLHEKLGFESDGYIYRNQKDRAVVLYYKLL